MTYNHTQHCKSLASPEVSEKGPFVCCIQQVSSVLTRMIWVQYPDGLGKQHEELLERHISSTIGKVYEIHGLFQ